MSTFISSSKNFVFIHVPKVGGTSIYSLLRHHGDLPAWVEGTLRTVNRLFYGLNNREIHIGNFHYFHHHVSAEHVRESLGASRYDAMTSFGFVRNPWDWVLSNYSYRQNVLRPIWPEIPHQSFEGYLNGMESGTNVAHGGLYFQSSLIFSADGTQRVSHIGRFENLAADLARICDIIGVSYEGLERLNTSPHSDFREYYSPRTSALVRRLYACDIERFGYEADAPC